MKALWQRALEQRRDVSAIEDLRRLSGTGRRTRMTVQERRLARRIADEHGVPLDLMLSRSRVPSVAHARHHFVAVLRWSTGMSYPSIGALVDRDHTSIIAAERKYEATLNAGAS